MRQESLNELEQRIHDLQRLLSVQSSNICKACGAETTRSLYAYIPKDSGKTYICDETCCGLITDYYYEQLPYNTDHTEVFAAQIPDAAWLDQYIEELRREFSSLHADILNKRMIYVNNSLKYMQELVDDIRMVL